MVSVLIPAVRAQGEQYIFSPPRNKIRFVALGRCIRNSPSRRTPPSSKRIKPRAAEGYLHDSRKKCTWYQKSLLLTAEMLRVRADLLINGARMKGLKSRPTRVKMMGYAIYRIYWGTCVDPATGTTNIKHMGEMRRCNVWRQTAQYLSYARIQKRKCGFGKGAARVIHAAGIWKHHATCQRVYQSDTS